MKNNEPVHIGRVLKKLRMSKQMSQDDLANQSSLDRGHIGSLEQDKHEPTLSTLLALAIGLDIDFMDLMRLIYNDYKNG
ncbi:helix-turn-helix domain-containing protein [Mesobacillus maritimus]|uniref:Helix-turn-helix transcriptional regulator n=1 Tax=Mesobacillus maritimus TaxID=1643336 RepID=A0ABS7K4W4_9BACI|nr:helix-turn-helix transcriptional regulator [Mesobacillus maritimus]MBY0097308.1 helix-turn-helix transcriptional regulator [Mesobacillus maritimus]